MTDGVERITPGGSGAQAGEERAYVVRVQLGLFRGDAASWLAGSGGLLDRIDSLLFALAIVQFLAC